MPATQSHDTNPYERLLRYVVAIPAMVAVLLGGLWLFAGELAPAGFNWSIGFGVLWFVIAWLGLRLLGRRFAGWRRVGKLTLAATGTIVLVLFLWTSLRDVTVNEEIAIGAAAAEVGDPSARAALDAVGNWTGADAPPATDEAPTPPPASGNIEIAAGEFETQAHSSSGRAAIVRLVDGSHVLTFENLDTDNGPDLRVYLVDGPAEEDQLGDFIDLGGLKGNKGNQQYEIPADVDVSRFTSVSIWCRAFSVGFAKADLELS